MTKIIHCFKAGVFGFGNHDISCIESWKRVYPDFEIKYWTDKDCRELMMDCDFARFFYEERKYPVITMDYVRLKIVYEYGGLYMDTDVYAVNRIPDKYFEKTFLPWNSLFEATWTNCGTCFYAEPHNPVIKEMMDVYLGLFDKIPVEQLSTYWVDNRITDEVFLRRGLDISDKMTCSLNDQDLGDVRIVNRVQFGTTDAVLGYNTLEDDRKPYLVHCFASVWAAPIKYDSAVCYLTLSDDTDLVEFSKNIDVFIGMREERLQRPIVLTIFVNTLKGLEKEFVLRLLTKVPQYPGTKKLWKFLNVGDNLPKKELYDVVTDFICKRSKDAYMCFDFSLSAETVTKPLSKTTKTAIYYIMADEVGEEVTNKLAEDFFNMGMSAAKGVINCLMVINSKTDSSHIKELLNARGKDRTFIGISITKDRIEEKYNTLNNLILSNFKNVIYCRNISSDIGRIANEDFQKL